MAEITEKDKQKIVNALERLTKSFEKILKARNYESAMEQAVRTIKVLCDLYESLTVVVIDKETKERIENAVLPKHYIFSRRRGEKVLSVG